MADRSDTRARMIAAAAGLLRRDGYAATGWRRVVAEAGTPWGSAYHCFPDGKDELVAEAIQLGGAAVASALETALEEGEDIADGVRRWFDIAATNLATSGYVDGCPVATVALEAAPDSERITAACAAQLRGWTARLARGIADAGVAYPRAENLATVIVSSLEGSLITARLARSTSAMSLSAEAMETLVRREIAG